MKAKTAGLQEELGTLYKDFETRRPSVLRNCRTTTENAECNANVEGDVYGKVER